MAARAGVLSQISTDSDYWFCVYANDPGCLTYPFEFSLAEPPVFAESGNPPPGVFEKIIRGFVNRSLSIDEFGKAINRFAQFCTAGTWKIYRNVIEQKYTHGSDHYSLYYPSVERFNEFCPEQYRLPVFPASPWKKTRSSNIAKPFMVESFVSEYREYAFLVPGQRITIWSGKNGNLTCFWEGRTDLHRPYQYILDNSSLQVPIVLEVVIPASYTRYYLRDIFLMDEFRRRKITMPLVARTEMLKDLYWGLDLDRQEHCTDLIERVRIDKQPLAKVVQTFLEQNYAGVGIRSQYDLADSPTYLMVPDQTETVLCVGLVQTDNRVEGLRAKTLDGKEFSIRYGLTFPDKERLSSNPNEIVGKSIRIDHIGIQNGTPKVPVFRSVEE